MQVLKTTTAILTLGVIAFSSKANANLPSTTWLKQEFKLQLAQANLQDAAKYFDSGIKRLKQGDYQGAIADFTKAIEMNPKLVAAYYNRAIARHQLQDYQRAIADFTKVIQINSNDAEAYYNRGVARTLLGDKQGEITDFQQAAQLFQKQGREAEAQKVLEIIVRVRM